MNIDSNSLARWEIYSPVSIGFEETWRRLDALANNPSNYPPYNIVKIDDNTQQLELALAGFEKEDIVVSVEKKVLNILVQKEMPKAEYVHKGIANRTFSRNWQLSEDTVIDEVTFVNGLLSITLKRELPEEHRRKVFNIH